MIILSIIIPSFNQGQYILQTLQSVVSQITSEIEILVVDGGSEDNSVDIIRQNEQYLSYWHSKKDNGQSDAINQGIRMAKGKYVTWLNSDDVLLPGAISIILRYIKENPEYVWFLGNVLWMNKVGQIIKVGKVEKDCWFWNKRYLLSNGGPSAIMNRLKLLEIGLLREDFHYSMDTELWYRFLANGHKFKRINGYLWGLRLHEEAKMSGHNFTNSPLADLNHPSWVQRYKETAYINKCYPRNGFFILLWRLHKMFQLSFYTRFFDKYLIGKNYNQINC